MSLAFKVCDLVIMKRRRVFFTANYDSYKTLNKDVQALIVDIRVNTRTHLITIHMLVHGIICFEHFSDYELFDVFEVC